MTDDREITMKCKTSNYENIVASFFQKVEKDYGMGLVQYWITDHIQKAKEGLPSYLMKILDRKRQQSDSIMALDLCCGWGESVANCLINGVNCYGVDKDEKIRFGKKLLNENHLPCRLIRGDAFSLPFRKETFDIIFSFSSLEHIKDPESLFRIIHLILKENGIFFFNFPNMIYPVDGHTMLWGVPYLPHHLAEKYVKYRRKRRQDDVWDVWYHKKRNVTRWLTQSGFKIVEGFINFDNSKHKKSFFKKSVVNFVKKLGVDPYAILSMKAPMIFMVAEK